MCVSKHQQEMHATYFLAVSGVSFIKQYLHDQWCGSRPSFQKTCLSLNVLIYVVQCRLLCFLYVVEGSICLSSQQLLIPATSQQLLIIEHVLIENVCVFM